MSSPLPRGFRLCPDPTTRRLDGDRLLVGGVPRRVLRLTDAGARSAAALLDGAAVTTPAHGALARRLVATGLAHPVPPTTEPPLTAQVVVPTYDDPDELAIALDALHDLDVTVVDDGSTDRSAVEAVAATGGARVIRRRTNGGPAAARNTGSADATGDVVVFVDSDAVVTATQVEALLAHFADPEVVAVAPRVRGATPTHGVLGVLARWWSPLDLGDANALVDRRGRVGYVPSTVLLVRRSALHMIGGFDESLRYGEDVDLVWRLVAAGGSVRYDADVQVRHAEPTSWRHWCTRRFRYGTSAAALSRRHDGGAVTLSLRPAPAVVLALLLARRPIAATALAGATTARVQRRLRRSGVPAQVTRTGAALAPAYASLAAARWLTQLWWPALAAASMSRRTRHTAALIALTPPLVEWVRCRPPLDPVRWTGAVLLDDMTYGAGVWWGCLTARTWKPLLPHVR